MPTTFNNPADPTSLEKDTKLQRDCIHWHEEIQKRLTTSNFGSVVEEKETKL